MFTPLKPLQEKRGSRDGQNFVSKTLDSSIKVSCHEIFLRMAANVFFTKVLFSFASTSPISSHNWILSSTWLVNVYINVHIYIKTLEENRTILMMVNLSQKFWTYHGNFFLQTSPMTTSCSGILPSLMVICNINQLMWPNMDYFSLT